MCLCIKESRWTNYTCTSQLLYHQCCTTAKAEEAAPKEFFACATLVLFRLMGWSVASVDSASSEPDCMIDHQWFHHLIVSDTICYKMQKNSVSGHMACRSCLLFPKFDRFSVCNWNDLVIRFLVFFHWSSGFFPGIRILETFSIVLKETAPFHFVIIGGHLLL